MNTKIFGGKKLDDWIKHLSGATELVAAVAYVSGRTLNRVVPENKMKTTSGLFLVGGSDYITDVDALKHLKRWSDNNSNFEAYLVPHGAIRQGLFHPKLYVIRKRGSQSALIGSGNLTERSRNHNYESMTLVSDTATANAMRNWVHSLVDSLPLIPLTSETIKSYALDRENRERLDREVRQRAKKQSRALKPFENYTIPPDDYRRLLADIDIHVASRNKTELRNRQKQLEQIKDSLDIKGAKPTSEGIREFYNCYVLGNMRRVYVEVVARRNQRVGEIICVLKDKDQPLSDRVQRAVNMQKGVGINFVTKILTAWQPMVFPSMNNVVNTAMDQYNASFQRGLSVGEQYEAYAAWMRRVLDETSLENMVELDYFFYRSLNK